MAQLNAAHKQIIEHFFAEGAGVGTVLEIEHLQCNAYNVLWQDFELATKVKTIVLVQGDVCIADTHGVTQAA